jgi:hypothetical protein
MRDKIISAICCGKRLDGSGKVLNGVGPKLIYASELFPTVSLAGFQEAAVLNSRNTHSSNTICNTYNFGRLSLEIKRRACGIEVLSTDNLPWTVTLGEPIAVSAGDILSAIGIGQ